MDIHCAISRKYPANKTELISNNIVCNRGDIREDFFSILSNKNYIKNLLENIFAPALQIYSHHKG
jgi:hypothetical protein